MYYEENIRILHDFQNISKFSLQVCGFPLVTNVFVPTGEYCRVSQKKCLRHYCWAKLRRAEIDMERVRQVITSRVASTFILHSNADFIHQWLKLDELIEQEHQIRSFLIARTGVLNLMLHSTYDHDLMNQLALQSQQNRQAEPNEDAEDDDVEVM